MDENIISPWDNDYTGKKLEPVYQPLWDMLKSFLQSFPIKAALDFGCGDGNYAFLLGGEGISVTGIDISANAIKKAEQHKDMNDGENCCFICGNSIPDDLPDDSFDAVIMLNAYHCMKNKERTNIIIQADRVLKPDGYLFLSVLAMEDESYPRKDWEEIEYNTFDDGRGKLFHFFSQNEISSELKGYRILDNSMLQNIHPEIGRKSALHVITAKRL